MSVEHQRRNWLIRAWARIPRGERVNTITHGVGLALSCLGAVVLLLTARHAGPWRLIGCLIFAMTLISVYAASTLSHFFADRDLRLFFRKMDQGCIYLLIVGTYTPFSLAYLRTAPWWLFLATMWTIGLAGFVSKVYFTHRVEGVSVWLYVVLGWLPIFPTPALISRVPSSALWWMLAGGLCYTIGTIFLIADWKRYHFHGIWHAWVMAGSTLHYLAIWTFIAGHR